MSFACEIFFRITFHQIIGSPKNQIVFQQTHNGGSICKEVEEKRCKNEFFGGEEKEKKKIKIKIKTKTKIKNKTQKTKIQKYKTKQNTNLSLAQAHMKKV
jgi:hypothetical protein